MQYLPFLFLAFNGIANATPEQLITTVESHIQIKDYASAVQEAQQGIKQFPNEKRIWEIYIQTLSKNGLEKEMWPAWMRYQALDAQAIENRKLLEEMAWGVITNATCSQSPVTRIMGLLGAFFGEDVRGVYLINNALHDNNNLVRSAALQLACRLRDQILIDHVYDLLLNERSWRVRLLAIKAVGTMKIEKAKLQLFSILSSPSHAEEKAAAIQSIVALMDSITGDELAKLTSSDRAGLRMLACEAVAYFDQKEHVTFITSLLDDSNPEVRLTALQALGHMRINDPVIISKIHKLLQDSNYQVALTAAWMVTLNTPQKGMEEFLPWFSHRDKNVRLFAAAALSATGKYGAPLMIKLLRQHPDPFVKANLAIALIGEREFSDEAVQNLYDLFMQDKRRWAWQEFGNFRALGPSSQMTLNEDLEVANQLARLDILNILAVMRHPKAQEAIIRYLGQKNWGISATASALLLIEGDQNAIDLVKDLLNHPSAYIRGQAALILSLWSREESAITVLEESYKGADRELKEKILEGIGHIGARRSVPFLIDKMQEPYQTLRVIAASALLQALNH